MYKVLVGKHEVKIPLGRPRIDGGIILRCIFRKWFGGMDWIHMAQDKSR